MTATLLAIARIYAHRPCSVRLAKGAASATGGVA